MKGRKRQIVVDTLGLVLDVKVHRADIQNRKAAKKVLSSLREKFPTVKVVYGDQGYSGEVVKWAKGKGIKLEIVYPWWRQIKTYFPELYGKLGKEFKVIPKRWIV